MVLFWGLSAVGLLAVASGSGNPFMDKTFYINPVNAKEFDSSIATATGTTQTNLQKMQQVPSAYWIDRKIKIRGQDTTTVEGILRDAASKSPSELVVLMWYDLPNRDCDAKASNGEICCKKNTDGTCDYLAPGDCSEGLEEYKSGYVDPFASVLGEYEGRVQVVLVVEPDGLANLATNIAHPHCGNIATQTAYKEGVKYAVNQIVTKAPSVAIYLDAAHGGWLGWANNLESFMKMLKGLALPFNKIRGFATNVANYQALGVQCPWCPDQGFRNGYCMNGKHASDPCCADPCRLISQWNFGNNELNYAAGLVAAANAVLGMDAHVIIDTGRNGVTDQRQDCANWCNPRGAGTGVPATTETANTSLVDAYFWLKTPGESDGCSQTLPSGQKCPRFDSKCASVDSLGTKAGEPPAPEAGMWFDFQVKQLAKNAVFDPPQASGTGSCPKANSPAPPYVPPPPSPAASPAAPSPSFFPSAPPSAISNPPGIPAPVLNPGMPLATGPPTAVGGSSSSGGCAGAYQQCGGQSWSGPTCCETGCQCTDYGGGGYYSQCVPGNPSTGTCSGSSGSAAAPPPAPAPIPQPAPLPLLPPTTAPTFAPVIVAQPYAPTLAPAFGPGAGTASGAATGTGTATTASGGFAPAPTPPPPVVLTPKPTPAPTPAPTPPPGLRQPSSTAAPILSVPSSSGSECAAPYGQCGGANWNGPTCCRSTCDCKVMDPSRDTQKSWCVPKGSVAVMMKDATYASMTGTPLGNEARGHGWGVALILFAVGLAAAVVASVIVRHARTAWGASSSEAADEVRPQEDQSPGLLVAASPSHVPEVAESPTPATRLRLSL